MRAFYLGDFPDEGYADVFVRAANEVISGVGLRHHDGLEDLEDNDLPEDGGLGRPLSSASRMTSRPPRWSSSQAQRTPAILRRRPP